MTCEKAMALMSAKLDGVLTPEEEKELTAHLADCPDCANLMETLRGLDEKVADLAQPAPEGLKKGVLYRIDQATGKVKSPRRRWFGPGAALGGVAALLVLLVGLKVIPLKGFEGAASAAPESAQKQYEGFAETVLKAPDSVETGAPAATQQDFYQDSTAKWTLEGVDNADGQKVTQFGYDPSATGIVGNADAPSVAGEPVEAGTATKGEAAQNQAGEGSGEDTAEDLDLPGASASSLVPDASGEDMVYPVTSGSNVTVGNGRPVSKVEEILCAALCQDKDAAVLFYSEFDPESLFGLLQEEQPELYALVENLTPENKDGMIRYQTNCGTIMAIQEWLLAQLPHTEDMDPRLVDAETKLMSRMETLDPGSGSLYRIITWAPRDHAILWPESWPEGWDLRLRTGENWRLFFPDEDYVANASKTAYLIFPSK